MWIGKAERLTECGPAALARRFAVVAEHYRTTDWRKMADGRHELSEGVFVLVSRPTGRGKSHARLEVHNRHLDAQFALEGRDVIGWRNRTDCQRAARPEPPENDIAFFDDESNFWIPIEDDTVAVFWPGDAHAPLGGEGAMRKAVYKIPVA